MRTGRQSLADRIDLATVNDRLFVNNVSLGVYAKIVQSPEYRDAKRQTTTRMLPELLGPFSKAHPGIDIELAVENRDAVVRRLREGAAFGQLSYDVTPTVTLTVGGRASLLTNGSFFSYDPPVITSISPNKPDASAPSDQLLPVAGFTPDTMPPKRELSARDVSSMAGSFTPLRSTR